MQTQMYTREKKNGLFAPQTRRKRDAEPFHQRNKTKNKRNLVLHVAKLLVCLPKYPHNTLSNFRLSLLLFVPTGS